ncbi:ABC transporter ATP-binding protein [Flavobacterium sedimenticola]|uniref:Polysaccharide ABC transporter ATP-binding protein n=1 Tax=Flavobacterium sedimenticola TaxID=3043286 RepID=A0ABT6XRG6_9FLAO|nr:polysaccharide ABC transporter ATP-binding protein [Flavobacterium sedimenticola]MDI9257682.1 polysaccharide ABC transporter ATP-binding protein [Flavobacterium sedimenticola]
MKPVIQVEHLSKAYQIGQFGTGTISRDLERFWMTKVLGKADPFLKIGETNDRTRKGNSDIVWSLKDINFEINQGEAVGIIGKNGAGKSTLLKLLSRVTGPTTGEIKVKGRIASLLEVGTGFHPELTGRENIYLNGAILGMRKKEITRKLDEIIDFSGVERYIDTPVKRYSSGMYVRLAFAVAAHLESEILIVDEVLAVGDAEFQKKCLGKMGDISKGQGRTVLFVSHNMAAVQSLCSKGIVLENGSISYNGAVEGAVAYYLKASNDNAHRVWPHQDGPQTDFLRLLEVKVLDVHNEIALNHLISNEVRIEFTYEITKEGALFTHGLNLFNNHNIHIFSSHDKDSETLLKPSVKGIYTRTIRIPGNLLADGGYTCSFAIMRYEPFQVELHEMEIVGFTIIDELDSTDIRGKYTGRIPGVVRPLLEWQ